jgi:GNAT superfamily N-acetyltransferase
MPVRKATSADAVDACQVLRRSIVACCVEDHGNDPAVLSLWLRNKTPEAVAAWFAAPQNFPVVATRDDGRIVGVALLTSPGEIALCYALPELRFTGVGRSLLRALEAHAQQVGLRRIFLHRTATAMPFYRRHGFAPGGAPGIESGIPAFPLAKSLEDACQARAHGVSARAT